MLPTPLYAPHAYLASLRVQAPLGGAGEQALAEAEPPQAAAEHAGVPAAGSRYGEACALLTGMADEACRGWSALRVVTGVDISGFSLGGTPAHDAAFEQLLEVLPALNTNRQLLDLAFDLNVPIESTLPPNQLWAGMLSSVRRLHINCDLGGYVVLDAGMEGMSSLQDLRMDVSLLETTPMCRLPPHLTRLFLPGPGSIDCLNQQVSRLAAECWSAFWCRSRYLSTFICPCYPSRWIGCRA